MTRSQATPHSSQIITLERLLGQLEDANHMLLQSLNEWKSLANQYKEELDEVKARATYAEVKPVVGDEMAAFREWFEGEQGVAYDGMWTFAKAAWMARANLGSQDLNLSDRTS